MFIVTYLTSHLNGQLFNQFSSNHYNPSWCYVYLVNLFCLFLFHHIYYSWEPFRFHFGKFSESVSLYPGKHNFPALKCVFGLVLLNYYRDLYSLCFGSSSHITLLSPFCGRCHVGYE